MDDIEHVRAERDAAYELVDTLRTERDKLTATLAEARAESDAAEVAWEKELERAEAQLTQLRTAVERARDSARLISGIPARVLAERLDIALSAVGTETQDPEWLAAVNDAFYELMSLDYSYGHNLQPRAAAKLSRARTLLADLLDGKQPRPASAIPALPTDAEYEARIDAMMAAKAPEVVKVRTTRPASTERTGVLGIHDLSLHHFVKVSTRVGYHFAVVADLAHEGALEDMSKRPGVFDADAVRGLLNLYAECAEYYARSDWFDADAMDEAVLRVRDSEKPEALAHDQDAVHELIRCVMNLACVDGETVAAAERVRDSGYAYYASSRTERDKHVAELVAAARPAYERLDMYNGWDKSETNERLRAALAKFEVQL